MEPNNALETARNPESPDPEIGAMAALEQAAEFRIAFIEGVTLSKWGGIWKQRHPGVSTTYDRVERADQVKILHDKRADVAFVRFPIDSSDLHAIPLYSEVPMVVVPKGHAAAALEELSLADLAGEHLIQDPAEIPDWSRVAHEMLEGTRKDLPAPDRIEDAIELVAAGIGIVIIPQSVARLFARKDVVHRPVIDLDHTRIALAWRQEGDAPELEARIEEFIGIVRGRTARSSRGTAEAAPEKPAPKKKQRPEPPKKKGGYVRITRKPSAKKRGRR